MAGPGDEALLEDIETERKLQEQKQAADVGEHDGKASGNKKSEAFAALNRVRRKPVPGAAEKTPDTTTLGLDTDVMERPQTGRLSDDSIERQSIAAGDAGHRYENRSEGKSGQPCIWDQPPPLPPRPAPLSRNSGNPPTPALPPGGEDTQAKRRSGQSISPGAVRETFHRLRSSFDMPVRTTREALPTIIKPKSPARERRNGSGEFIVHPLSLRPKRNNDKTRETHSPSPFHITLIRRDPTHGNQWNVGTITNCIGPSTVAPDGSIAIEITTPGYKKLADKKPIAFEDFGIDTPASLRDLLSTKSSHGPATTPTGPLKFVRRLIPYHNLSGDSPSDLSPPRLKTYPIRSRDHYTFTSPWNGTCTFGPGANSRTLRCRHIIPYPKNSIHYSSPRSPSSSSAPAPPAVTVAEIRFNLPTFPCQSPRPTSSDGIVPPNKDPRRSNDSLASPIDEDRLDLSLARERAGGGMRGNSAKLGKLIIEDEGLKMVDLLVAASMGVFWGVYDHALG